MLFRAADPRMVNFTERLAQSCAVAVIAISLAALIGWAGNWQWLKSLSGSSNHVAMNPVTAIAFIILTIGFWLLCQMEAGPGWRSRQLAHLIALLVIAMGV